MPVAFLVAAFPSFAQAQWPDPGGDPDAAIPVPPNGKYFGFNDDTTLGGHGLTPSNYVDAARRAGANAIRGRLDWRVVQPTRDGGFNWEAYEPFYESATDAGLTPILVLGGTPVWARDILGMLCRGPRCVSPPAPWEIGSWAEFAERAALEFPDAIFETWNEPNLGGFWFLPNPDQYARMQAFAYNAIKAVAPDTMVLSAGFANTSVTTNPFSRIAMEEFVRRAYAASPSIKGHMDALAFHPFPGGDDGSADPPNLGADTPWARGFAQIRGVRDDFNDQGTPLFITETGLTRTQGYSEQEQLAGIRRTYRKALSTQDVLGVVFHRIIEPRDVARATDDTHGFAWLKYGTGYPAEPFSVYCGFVQDAGNSYSRCP